MINKKTETDENIVVKTLFWGAEEAESRAGVLVIQK